MLDSGHVTDDEGRIFNVHLRTTETRNVVTLPRTQASVGGPCHQDQRGDYLHYHHPEHRTVTLATSLTSLTLTTTMHGIMSLEIALRALYNV